METKLIGKDKLGEAAELIVSGELVAVPTETVYGLHATALTRRQSSGCMRARADPR